ncbi:hypothetical protein FOXYSP1_20646 [Fusarium oxysporum f. sp. phaseoli]
MKLAVIIFLDSLLDFTGYIVAFCQIRLIGIGCLQTSSDRHYDSEAVVLLAVTIRRYRGSWVGLLTAFEVGYRKKIRAS